jgi:tetratricopeptide (TPR) repeat protein
MTHAGPERLATAPNGWTDRLQGRPAHRSGRHLGGAGRVLLCVIAALLAQNPAPVLAQQRPTAAAPARPRPPTAAAKARAKQFLLAGDAELARGDKERARRRERRALEHYARALRAYEEAHANYQDPQIFFPIAQAEERLGRLPEALAHYRQVLSGTARPGDELRALVELRIEAIGKLVAAVVVNAEPAGAQVQVDGRPVGQTPLSGPVYLVPGRHRLAVKKPGFIAVERDLVVEAGTRTEESVSLVAARGKPPAPVAVAARPPHFSRRGLHIRMIATGSLAAIDAGLAVATLLQHRKYRDENASIESRESARSAAKTLALVTDGVLVATIAAAAYTSYYYYRVYKPARQRYESGGYVTTAGSSWLLGPLPLGTNGGGVAVAGRF